MFPEEARDAIGEQTVILPLLNGVDTKERIARSLPHAKIWQGCIYIISRLTAPGVPGPRVVLARPRCYMNEVGGPVKALATFYKVPPARVVAIHDELDIPFDTMRVKLGGGDNGHNGLRSMRSALGTGDFHRVRVGIGRPPGRQDVSDFVLSNYSSAERKVLPFQVSTAADAVETLVTEGLERTQQRFNS